MTNFWETVWECVEACAMGMCAIAVAGPVIACIVWMIVQALGRA